MKVVPFCGGYGMSDPAGPMHGALPAAPPQSAFHCVDVGDDDRVFGILRLQAMPLWGNGGYFVLRPEIVDHLPCGGDLIADACPSSAKEGRLLAHRHRGFWQPADGEGAARAEGGLPGGRPVRLLWEPELGTTARDQSRDPLVPAAAAGDGTGRRR